MISCDKIFFLEKTELVKGNQCLEIKCYFNKHMFKFRFGGYISVILWEMHWFHWFHLMSIAVYIAVNILSNNEPWLGIVYRCLNVPTVSPGSLSKANHRSFYHGNGCCALC